MKDILDFEEREESTIHSLKSFRAFIGSVLIIGFLILAAILEVSADIPQNLMDWIYGLPFIVLLVVLKIGFVEANKSIKHSEPNGILKLVGLIGNFSFAFILTVLFTKWVCDLLKNFI